MSTENNETMPPNGNPGFIVVLGAFVASFTIAPSRVSTAPANTSSCQSIASSPFTMAGFKRLNKLRAYISLAW